MENNIQIIDKVVNNHESNKHSPLKMKKKKIMSNSQWKVLIAFIGIGIVKHF